MAKPQIDDPFKPGEKVRATVELPRVPEGTQGKIALANGLTWRRYWVRFDNGHVLGQIDQDDLVRTKHWDKWHHRQAEAEKAAAEAAANPQAVVAASDGGGGGAAANAYGVPEHLIERSRLARERLGG